VSDEQPEGYEMAYPLVVCQSNGGPYDDDAFVAGAQLGQIVAELRERQPPLYERYVDSALVPQIDLVAMHEGYAMQAEPWDEHPDEWTLVTLRRQGSVPT
jgi:hypothetical protein